MIKTAALDGNLCDAESATLHCIQFTSQGSDNQAVLMSFADPVPRKALILSTLLKNIAADSAVPDRDTLDIITLPTPPKDSAGLRDELTKWVCGSALGAATPAIATMIHGAQIIWRPGRAAILAAPERIDSLLSALVDFSYYENELRTLEQEVADSWTELEVDAPLASEVAVADLERCEAVGLRMKLTLQRRMRHVRVEPHLYRAGAHLPSQAQELGDRLREKCRIESRLEALDGHLETFEHIYEMTSQRISEFRAARHERRLEWTIIILLAVETILLLAELLHSLEA